MCLSVRVLLTDATGSLCTFDCCQENYRKLGLGRKLYEHFIKCAKEKHCLKVKAITRPINLDSIAFHKKIGMELTGNGVIDGVPVVYDYAGPGEHRVVFMKDI